MQKPKNHKERILLRQESFENIELQILIEKCNKIGKRADNNLIFQMLFIAIGLLTIFAPNLMEELSLPFVGKADYEVLQYIVPSLLFYFFVQVGYLLYNYHTYRKLLDKRANEIYCSYTDEDADSVKNREMRIHELYHTFKESRMLEMIYMVLKDKNYEQYGIIRDLTTPQFKGTVYPFIASFIVSIFVLSNSLVFYFLIFRIGEDLTTTIVYSVTLVLVTAFIVGSYRDYNLLSKDKYFVKITIMVAFIVPIVTALLVCYTRCF